MTWAREFRYDAGRQRYLDRKLNNPTWSSSASWTVATNGDTWTDYDPISDEPYGDFTVTLNTPPTPPTMTNARSFELGIGRVDPFASSGTTNSSYYHTDMLGTTRMLTNSAGMTESATYTAFGERIDSAQTGGAKRYGFVGAYGYQAHSSSEMSFLHVGARYYDPASGRFLQRDPIGIRGGFGVYRYVLDRPGRLLDPSGLGFVDDLKSNTGTGTVIGGAIGGTVGSVAGGVAGSGVPGAGTLAGVGAGGIIGAGAGGVVGMMCGAFYTVGDYLFEAVSDWLLDQSPAPPPSPQPAPPLFDYCPAPPSFLGKRAG